MSNATELLRRARNVFGNCRGDDAEDLFDEICAFLDVDPEAEPYAWAWDEIMSDGLEPVADMDRPVDNEYRTNIRPLFLHSPRPEPARKPMTEEEMDVGFNPYRMRWLADDQYFVAGVRWAEKHHGIGKDDE